MTFFPKWYRTSWYTATPLVGYQTRSAPLPGARASQGSHVHTEVCVWGKWGPRAPLHRKWLLCNSKWHVSGLCYTNRNGMWSHQIFLITLRLSCILCYAVQAEKCTDANGLMEFEYIWQLWKRPHYFTICAQIWGLYNTFTNTFWATPYHQSALAHYEFV